jgi:hypothetical protein
MNYEAGVPVFGWLALMSQPAIGYGFVGHRGLMVGAGSAALVALGPVFVKTDWHSSMSISEVFNDYGYFFLMAVAGLFLAPLVALQSMGSVGGTPEAETRDFLLTFLGMMALASFMQARIESRVSEKTLLSVSFFGAVLLGCFWIFRSYIMRVEVTDGVGYDGLFELAAYMNSITICALFGPFLIFARQRSLKPFSK